MQACDSKAKGPLLADHQNLTGGLHLCVSLVRRALESPCHRIWRGLKSTHWEGMNDRYTGCADSPRIDGARNQTFLNVPKKNSFKTFFLIYMYNLNISFPILHHQSQDDFAEGKRPPPLHVSLQWIEAERANVMQRTKNRIWNLNAAVREDRTARAHGTETDNWHCCLNTICFCMLLVLLSLLFWQWLYYKSLNLNLKQL